MPNIWRGISRGVFTQDCATVQGTANFEQATTVTGTFTGRVGMSAIAHPPTLAEDIELPPVPDGFETWVEYFSSRAGIQVEKERECEPACFPMCPKCLKNVRKLGLMQF